MIRVKRRGPNGWHGNTQFTIIVVDLACRETMHGFRHASHKVSASDLQGPIVHTFGLVTYRRPMTHLDNFAKQLDGSFKSVGHLKIHTALPSIALRV